MSDQPRYRRALATVFITAGGDAADSWLVTETPDEAAGKIAAALEAGRPFAELTLGNPPEDGAGAPWNGRTVFVRAEHVTAVAPPLRTDADD